MNLFIPASNPIVIFLDHVRPFMEFALFKFDYGDKRDNKNCKIVKSLLQFQLP